VENQQFNPYACSEKLVIFSGIEIYEVEKSRFVLHCTQKQREIACKAEKHDLVLKFIKINESIACGDGNIYKTVYTLAKMFY
jgi:hypothetical protein